MKLFEKFTLQRLDHIGYISLALRKISKLALVGYKFSTGAQSANRAFFVRNISMRLHIVMAELERDTFECAGILLNLSTKPFSALPPSFGREWQSSVKSTGAHNHA